VGLGPERREGERLVETVTGRVPRNSPALFNLGAREFTTFFHDGRVEVDRHGFYESGFVTPARWKFPTGLESPLAAQAMFPPTSPVEMAGQQGENEVANARARNMLAGERGVWEALARRLREVPEYVELFRAAYPQVVESPLDVTYVRAANAIAAFESTAFRADDSPFDRFLRGEAALTEAATRGMKLFYGRANCASCHSGTFQTDHQFHAIAMPQIGPGTSDGKDSSYWSGTGERAFIEDFGRASVTARVEDRYRFRTPSLRNVAETGPWGHSGAFERLEDVVRHHLDPVESLRAYRLHEGQLKALETVVELVASGASLRVEPLGPRRRAAFLARDTWVQRSDELRGRIAAASTLDPVELDDREVEDLLAFLRSLSDERSLDLSHLIPARVPSGLPVAD
jgi:cytochrome c peroxidase